MHFHSRHKLIASLVMFTAILVAPLTFADDERSGETDHLEGEARQIADRVIECQRAGWENLDVDKYLSQFADDATVVLGRTSESGDYDVTYDHDTIVATRTMRMRGENPGIKLRYANIEVTIDGNEAIMTTRTITSASDSDYVEIMNERFILRQENTGWLVVEDRAWLTGEVRDGRRIPFNVRMWRSLDQYIEREKDSHDIRWLRKMLFHAYRHDEAHMTAIAVCEQDDATAEDWAIRGLNAVIAGDIDDAALAFATALEMDPQTWLPYYAVPADDDDE